MKPPPLTVLAVSVACVLPRDLAVDLHRNAGRRGGAVEGELAGERHLGPGLERVAARRPRVIPLGLRVRSVSTTIDSAGSVMPPAIAAAVLVPVTILLFVEFWLPAL